jgi:hypothetical protein
MNLGRCVNTHVMETFWWVAAVAFAWLVLSLAVGLLIGGAARMRDRVGAPTLAVQRASADDRPGGAQRQPRLFRLG